MPLEPTLDIPERQGTPVDWMAVMQQYPGKYVAGSSRLFLTQTNGSQIVGTVAIDPLDYTVMHVQWNPDTLTSNTGIDSAGLLDHEPGYDLSHCYRPNSPGTFDAIINPQSFNPKRPRKQDTDQPVVVGTRYLIIDEIGNVKNAPGKGASAWQDVYGHDFVADVNDIIEWTGETWTVVFHANQDKDTLVWQTNIYTGIQYLWNGVSWAKSFEGVYTSGQWSLVL